MSKDKHLVLAVEDDENAQKLMGFFLQDYCDLEFAISVLEAKKKLESDQIELVLLDLSLIGDEDGLDLARYLRKSEKWKTIPIIATTAHVLMDDKDKCLKAGCNDYLTKPISRTNLLKKMKQQLDAAN